MGSYPWKEGFPEPSSSFPQLLLKKGEGTRQEVRSLACQVSVDTSPSFISGPYPQVHAFTWSPLVYLHRVSCLHASFGSWPLHLPASIQTFFSSAWNYLTQAPFSCYLYLLECPASFTCYMLRRFCIPSLMSIFKYLLTNHFSDP